MYFFGVWTHFLEGGGVALGRTLTHDLSIAQYLFAALNKTQHYRLS